MTFYEYLKNRQYSEWESKSLVSETLLNLDEVKLISHSDDLYKILDYHDMNDLYTMTRDLYMEYRNVRIR